MTPGVIIPTNDELRQSLNLSSLSVTCDSFETLSTGNKIERVISQNFKSSRYDKLFSICDAAAFPVLNYIQILELYLLMLWFYFALFCRGKLVDEETPSGLTSSVERGDAQPPISNMAPPSTAQHRWRLLSCTKLTEVSLQDPLIGFILRQDRDPPYPPQRSPGLPQCVWRDLSSGRSGRRQEWWVWGLNTSALLPTDPLGWWPPVIIIPRNKCIYYRYKPALSPTFTEAKYINSPLIGLVVVVLQAVVVFVKMKAVATETKMRSLVMMESYQALKLSNSKFRTKTTCDTIVDITNYVELLSYKM